MKQWGHMASGGREEVEEQLRTALVESQPSQHKQLHHPQKEMLSEPQLSCVISSELPETITSQPREAKEPLLQSLPSAGSFKASQKGVSQHRQHSLLWHRHILAGLQQLFPSELQQRPDSFRNSPPR